jgi:peptidoglycan/xylan/chitin deacetylase (PgdA/CDA1 family)
MRAILTYHSVDTTGSVISTAPSVLERHIRWLTSGRVAVLPLEELLARADERNALAITFDDGFANFRTEAWPRLKESGLPITLFVPTGFVGKTNTWGEVPGGRMPRLSILDWPTLAHLQEEGVTLGAHSRTHPDLRALDIDALQEEVEGSLEDLRRETGRRPEAFAYPYGYWNARAVSVVGATCRFACTTDLRPIGPHDEAALLPRLDVFHLRGPGRLENFGHASFRRFISVRLRVRRLGEWVRTISGGIF